MEIDCNRILYDNLNNIYDCRKFKKTSLNKINKLVYVKNNNIYNT